MKNKNLKKICGSICIAINMVIIPQINVMAMTSPASCISESTPEISTRAEVKGYKYKILNGRQWKRLWSYTYARWIDPKWTLA